MSEPPVGPVGKIALALSGGGYRAAAFHLGSMHTLHEAGLLPDVALLSTVSGGTFVGAAYALSLAEGQTFPEFFDQLRTRLQNARPVHRAVEILLRGRGSGLPRHTLIAAQADALAELFFGERKFGALLRTTTTLDEIAFNATDFRAGLPFRFLKSVNPRARIGNGRNSIPGGVAEQIRIADIVAASSCFPGGFEPIGFPDDFRWEDAERVSADLAEHRGEAYREPIPLMDGGVADNQGLGSLRDAMGRWGKKTGQSVGMVFISDADPAADKPLLRHTLRPTPGRFRVGDLVVAAQVVCCLALIAAALLGWRLVNMLWTRDLVSWPFMLESVLSFGVCATVAIGLGVAVWQTRGAVARGSAEIPGIDVWRTLSRLSLGWLIDLIAVRARSLLAMSSSVFTKNIRDLRYRELFADAEYRHRVLGNQIYDLAPLRHRQQTAAAAIVRTTPAIQALADRARDMPTTLWFEDDRQLDDVLLCGQLTACYNLLLWTDRRLREGDTADGPAPPRDHAPGVAQAVALRALRDRLTDIWARLREAAEG
jgi:predicted acylesterase/phospholipase RssA